jgi:hypothetical protein
MIDINRPIDYRWLRIDFSKELGFVTEFMEFSGTSKNPRFLLLTCFLDRLMQLKVEGNRWIDSWPIFPPDVIIITMGTYRPPY